MAIINSNSITFIDNTDNRKLEVYITSNLPATQIYDVNTKTYSPDWSKTNLNLSIDVYLQSNIIDKNIIPQNTYLNKYNINNNKLI